MTGPRRSFPPDRIFQDTPLLPNPHAFSSAQEHDVEQTNVDEVANYLQPVVDENGREWSFDKIRDEIRRDGLRRAYQKNRIGLPEPERPSHQGEISTPVDESFGHLGGIKASGRSESVPDDASTFPDPMDEREILRNSEVRPVNGLLRFGYPKVPRYLHHTIQVQKLHPEIDRSMSQARSSDLSKCLSRDLPFIYNITPRNPHPPLTMPHLPLTGQVELAYGGSQAVYPRPRDLDLWVKDPVRQTSILYYDKRIIDHKAWLWRVVLKYGAYPDSSFGSMSHASAPVFTPTSTVYTPTSAVYTPSSTVFAQSSKGSDSGQQKIRGGGSDDSDPGNEADQEACEHDDELGQQMSRGQASSSNSPFIDTLAETIVATHTRISSRVRALLDPESPSLVTEDQPICRSDPPGEESLQSPGEDQSNVDAHILQAPGSENYHGSNDESMTLHSDKSFSSSGKSRTLHSHKSSSPSSIVPTSTRDHSVSSLSSWCSANVVYGRDRKSAWHRSLPMIPPSVRRSLSGAIGHPDVPSPALAALVALAKSTVPRKTKSDSSKNCLPLGNPPFVRSIGSLQSLYAHVVSGGDSSKPVSSGSRRISSGNDFIGMVDELFSSGNDFIGIIDDLFTKYMAGAATESPPAPTSPRAQLVVPRRDDSWRQQSSSSDSTRKTQSNHWQECVEYCANNFPDFLREPGGTLCSLGERQAHWEVQAKCKLLLLVQHDEARKRQDLQLMKSQQNMLRELILRIGEVEARIFSRGLDLRKARYDNIRRIAWLEDLRPAGMSRFPSARRGERVEEAAAINAPLPPKAHENPERATAGDGPSREYCQSVVEVSKGANDDIISGKRCDFNTTMIGVVTWLKNVPNFFEPLALD